MQRLGTMTDFVCRAFNARSPWNVSAGRDSVDLSGLAAHYKEQDRLQEEARLARLQDGKVVTVYE